MTADTPAEERQIIIRRFETGATKIIVSVGVLVAGFDSDVRCIIYASQLRVKFAGYRRSGEVCARRRAKIPALSSITAALCTALVIRTLSNMTISRANLTGWRRARAGPLRKGRRSCRTNVRNATS